MARLLGLFLRSRRAGSALAGLVAIAAVAWWCFELRRSPAMIGPLTAVVPLGVATVVGVSAGSPFGETERTASRSLPVLRLGQLGGLLACGAMALGSTEAVGPAEVSVWSIVRNGAGFAGLALLWGRYLGAGTSWLPPTAYGLAVHAAAEASAVRAAWWLWPLRDGADRVAWTAALGQVIVGLGGAARHGARDAAGDGACVPHTTQGDRSVPRRAML